MLDFAKQIVASKEAEPKFNENGEQKNPIAAPSLFLYSHFALINGDSATSLEYYNKYLKLIGKEEIKAFDPNQYYF